MAYGSRYYSEWNDGQNADFGSFLSMKHTNLDLQDAAYIHVVHILQHPTSHPTTMSTHDTMVNAPKKNISPLPAGKYGKSTKQPTRQRLQANEGERGLEAERVRGLGALRSLQSKKELSAKKRRETHFLSHAENEKWIEDYVERETAVATMRVQDAETAIMQELKDMTTAESAWATTRKPETMFEDMLNAIGDSLSDLSSSVNEQDGEDDEDDEGDTELGKPSDDDEAGWVMGSISKRVQHRIRSVWLQPMSLDELMQPGWGDAANYFRESDMKYGTGELMVLVVVRPQIDSTAATTPQATFGEHMQILGIVRGQWRMLAVTSRPGRSQIRLGSEKPQWYKFLHVLSHDAVPDSALIRDSNPGDPVSVYPCIKHPEWISI